MNFDSTKYPTLTLASTVQELRKLKKEKLSILCNELRKYLLDTVSRSSGHFASGLGVIELTVALHYVYNTPFDYLIWDIGHQTYPHKILTGRRDSISTIRKKNGIHSFPWRNESEYDVLSVGHSSTSISAGLGMAIASKRKNENRRIACIIGDGAITAGIAFEAINHAGDIQPDILVILNDNKMSISENVGALNNYLMDNLSDKRNYTSRKNNKRILIQTPSIKKLTKYTKKHLKTRFTANALFEELGFNYIGPINGHDIITLINTLTKIRNLKGPQFLHIVTKKGKGYPPAEKDPITWHAVPAFNLNNGTLTKNVKNIPTYSEIFGDWLCEIAANDPKLIAITPAMREGSGMVDFSRKYPDQYFDVAIAEQHAVTFAAGMAIGGYKAIVAIYSTFLQRAYDQVIHDVAIPKLSILFAIDRAGIVGADGETHQGAFDISYLRCIPGMIIMTPSDENECRNMLYTGYNYKNGPCSVRYPRGSCLGITLTPLQSLPIGKGVIKRKGEKIAILNFGVLLTEASIVATRLNTTLIDMRFVKPLDENLIIELAKIHDVFVTLEEGVIKGGAGSAINEFIMDKKIRIFVLNIGLPDKFIPQGTQEEIRHDYQLDAIGIQKQIQMWMTI